MNTVHTRGAAALLDPDLPGVMIPGHGTEPRAALADIWDVHGEPVGHVLFARWPARWSIGPFRGEADYWSFLKGPPWPTGFGLYLPALSDRLVPAGLAWEGFPATGFAPRSPPANQPTYALAGRQAWLSVSPAGLEHRWWSASGDQVRVCRGGPAVPFVPTRPDGRWRGATHQATVAGRLY